jgi:hypothetical protein
MAGSKARTAKERCRMMGTTYWVVYQQYNVRIFWEICGHHQAPRRRVLQRDSDESHKLRHQSINLISNFFCYPALWLGKHGRGTQYAVDWPAQGK